MSRTVLSYETFTQDIKSFFFEMPIFVDIISCMLNENLDNVENVDFRDEKLEKVKNVVF